MKRNILIFLVILFINACYSQNLLTVKTELSEFNINRNAKHDIITLKNGELSDSVGNPSLPLKEILIAIPYGFEIDNVEIIHSIEEDIEGDYNIEPVQEPVVPILFRERIFKKNNSIYMSNCFYPHKIISKVDHGFMLGSKILTLKYYPIKYNPLTKKIRVISTVTFKLSYKLKLERKEPVRIKLNKTSFDYMINTVKEKVINPLDVKYNTILAVAHNSNKEIEKLNQSTIVAPELLTTEYVIITNEKLKSGFEEIANWKTRQGLSSKIITVEWISKNFSGSDMPEKVRTFIKHAHSNWGTIWFLLGGDLTIVPIRYAWISHFNHHQLLENTPNGTFIPTDMYYACLDGDWNADGDLTFGEGNWNRNDDGTFVSTKNDIDNVDRYYDVFVGRIPVKDSLSLILYKEKYFEYQYGTGLNSLKTLLFSANSDAINSSHMDYVASNYPSNITIHKRYECVGYYKTNCGTKADVLNAFNSSEGYHIICGYGHGSSQGFEACDASINKNEIMNLQNSKRSQILYNNHCETLALDNNCVGVQYLTTQNGGVAYIGNTRYGWTGDPSKYNNKFINNIYNSQNIGEAFFNAKGTGSQNDGYDRWGFFALNFLGDPEMQVWTDTPQPLNVSMD